MTTPNSTKERKWNNELKKYGLTGWKVIVTGGGALCRSTDKTIFLEDYHDWAMFLHEVAHALTYKWNERMGDKTGHHAIWGDKFTELIDKKFKEFGI